MWVTSSIPSSPTHCSLDVSISQDSTSNNCGTTCWDASLVLAKYIEKQAPPLKGKTVVELGSGISGLPGMCCALLGAETVVLTDTSEAVLSLLRHNVERNVSMAQIGMNGSATCRLERPPRVEELRWGVEADAERMVRGVSSIEYILAADCVYDEAAVGLLLRTILRLLEERGKPTTKILICNEYRSESVHSVFLREFGERFVMKKIPAGKLASGYKHELIHLWKMKLVTK
jgi:predicted nicotinamide N-methyase